MVEVAVDLLRGAMPRHAEPGELILDRRQVSDGMLLFDFVHFGGLTVAASPFARNVSS
jgi:hypothetical protein